MSELSRKMFLAETAAVREYLAEQEQQATAEAAPRPALDRATAVEPPATPPADRAALRDRIAEVLATTDGWTWAHGVQFADIDTPSANAYRKLADAVLAVLPPPADRAAATLTDREKSMLAFALELAQEEIHARSLDITDDDREALDRLRRMADETATTEVAPDDHTRAHLGAALASARLLRIYAGQLEHRGQVDAADVARRIRHIIAGLEDQPAAGARQDGATP